MLSCDNLGVNPYHWLKDTLKRIRHDMEEAELVRLLPYNYKS
ncbi:MAG: transposase domain-containing protein [Bacteroides sp.]|nr:transposase domain-containing protein [Bacteroides sp.]